MCEQCVTSTFFLILRIRAIKPRIKVIAFQTWFRCICAWCISTQLICSHGQMKIAVEACRIIHRNASYTHKPHVIIQYINCCWPLCVASSVQWTTNCTTTSIDTSIGAEVVYVIEVYVSLLNLFQDTLWMSYIWFTCVLATVKMMTQ